MANIMDEVRTARINAGLTQKQLAEKVGLKWQVLSAYERGVRNPKARALFKLAMALNIDAAELLKKYLQEETFKQKSIEKEKKI